MATVWAISRSSNMPPIPDNRVARMTRRNKFLLHLYRTHIHSTASCRRQCIVCGEHSRLRRVASLPGPPMQPSQGSRDWGILRCTYYVVCTPYDRPFINELDSFSPSSEPGSSRSPNYACSGALLRLPECRRQSRVASILLSSPSSLEPSPRPTTRQSDGHVHRRHTVLFWPRSKRYPCHPGGSTLVVSTR